jgi:hypothetical protein
MGYKNICFNCRKSFNMGTDFNNIRQGNCPECGEPMTLMTHRFRPPKNEDDKKWLTVTYLVDNGFTYQQIYEQGPAKDKQKVKKITVPYPDNLRDAEEFVSKYKDQANRK